MIISNDIKKGVSLLSKLIGNLLLSEVFNHITGCTPLQYPYIENFPLATTNISPKQMRRLQNPIFIILYLWSVFFVWRFEEPKEFLKIFD